MSDTKIILITLVHNRKGLLGRALQSAVNQTLPKKHFTHLVWDNFSQDGANEVAKVFCNKYSNMKFFQCDKNLGQQKAYNEILNKWIVDNEPNATVMCILDSDDELYPHALMEVKKMFDAHPEIGGAYSGFSLVDRKGRLIAKDHGKAKMVPNQFSSEGQLMLKKVFLGANPCGHLRCYSIKCLKEIGGFCTKYQYATDYNIFGSLMEKYSVVKIPSILYKFYQHGDQIQSTASPQQTKDWKDMQKEFREKWKKMDII